MNRRNWIAEYRHYVIVAISVFTNQAFLLRLKSTKNTKVNFVSNRNIV